MNTKSLPFYILVVAVFLIIISPEQFAEGMFMDGLLYATISRNLAIGLGDFWHLLLTHNLFPEFNEHPPLAMGLQSLWFKLLGDHLYVERLYSLTTYFITGFIMVKIWGKVVNGSGKKTGWLPLLFWIIIPVVFWSASNNMLENTMMVFTSLSVLLMLKGLTANRFLYFALAGFSIFLAFLTKGFTGLFTLSFPFWLFVFSSKEIRFSRFISDLTFVLIGFVFPVLLIYLFMPDGIDSFERYFRTQVVNSIENIQDVNNRFWIIRRFLREYSSVLIIVSLFLLFTRRIKVPIPHKKWIFILAGLGLSGILPIMVSLKQSGFYMLAAFPIISITLALLVQPKVDFLIQKLKAESKWFLLFKMFSFTLLLTAVVLLSINSNTISRDKERIEDIKAVSEVVGEETTIFIDSQLFPEWSLHGYFFRYSKISLTDKNREEYEYLLIPKGHEIEDGSEDLSEIPLKLHAFILYQQKK